MFKRLSVPVLASQALLPFLCAGIAAAQADRASISGHVVDPSGAALPGVSVTARENATGANFTAQTNTAGVYSIGQLPIGDYTVHMSHDGFSESQSNVHLVATQVQALDVTMQVGSKGEVVSVTAAPQLLDSETSTITNTLEEEALRDLPLNATNGRDAVQLLVQSTPSAAKSGISGNQVYSTLYLGGANSWTNTAYVDGVEADAGPQGAIATPGLEAIAETQVITGNASAELGNTGGGVLLFELKSGTNKIHGSAFEFLQNEALNANSWQNDYFLATCAPGDETCIRNNSRPRDRFNDYGGSLGGPIWKNRTFVFGDYEYYSQTNDALNPNATTVPTARMLSGDFGELLTGGTQQGNITNATTGAVAINPCTGQPYQYGQIFDPLTQQVVNGVTCATPFANNVIPASRISSMQSQQIVSLYQQYYKPTLTTRIYNNFPTVVSNTPSETKRSYDIKVDHNFSAGHHLSASFDYVKWISITGGGLVSTITNPGPLSAEWGNNTPNFIARIVDNYTITPNLLNTIGFGYSSTQYTQVPVNQVSSAAVYGFNSDGAAFPTIGFNSTNGVGEQNLGTSVDSYQNYYGYHYQDTLAWQRGNHSLKFGGQVFLQGLNSSYGGNIQNYNFSSETGGPTDTTLTPFVGSAFANLLLGNVQSASQNIPYPTYPRQKYIDAFAQDDWKVNKRFTLNMGLTWIFTFAGHQADGHWTNFDLTQQNPNWGSYKGAWAFAKDSGSTFQTDNSLHQFAPHLGGAYQINDKLVARANYGLYYVPLGEFNAGYGYGFPSQQAEFWTGTNIVPNSVPGSTAFNWGGGYPGQTVTLPRTASQTSFGYDDPLSISPKTLHLGRAQNFYAGIQYELAKNIILDTRYMGSRGADLHDNPESVGINYPDFNTYSRLLTSGHVNDTVSSAGQAAAAGVPYPYAGFSGPAYAAIAPIPQAASYNNTVVLITDQQLGSSAYNAFVAEIKARSAHNLNADMSYTISHLSGSNLARRSAAGGNGLYGYQSAADIPASHGYVQGTDQLQLVTGYITYQLPFGHNQTFLANGKLLNEAVGGWTIGSFLSYGSGSPMGTVNSPVQYPFFFQNQRDNFAPGVTADNIKNHFHGHNVDLGNTLDPKNQDFSPSLFTTPAFGTLGNTPYNYDHWRFNGGSANESVSLSKAFAFGPEDRFRATIRGEFYDVFNRHYVNSPDTNPNDTTFGQVTGVSGTARTGQLGARVQW
ncbi:TonB-dependent receptor [Acidipila sp. EB88]|uniref:TonB-dependent receptor n=1 Tax=Acidipila sp. EB88 TaxID=2305226 RepID=UPI000F5E253A|nr:TonB-dependent receptor [Acidipila sp. EB88]RRA49140.1 carboxypeptidase regulatory-like domain-containing protein [Acidipila sp. EB88]